jgi:hypothetical protein
MPLTAPATHPTARPATAAATAAATVYVSADVGDLLDGLLAASRSRDMAALVALEGAAVQYGLLNADQARVLAHWVDTLQTTL